MLWTNHMHQATPIVTIEQWALLKTLLVDDENGAHSKIVDPLYNLQTKGDII
jgi:hypothetical protein